MGSLALKNRVLEWAAPLCIAAALSGCMTVDEQPPSAEAGVVATPAEAGVVATQQALSSQTGNSMRLELREDLATDTFIRTGTNTNYGGETSMVVGGAASGSFERRSLLWFDLGQLPRAVGTTPRIRVDRARLDLSLVAPATDSIPYALSNAGRSWVEGRHNDTSTCTTGATWNRPNCATATTWVGGDFLTPNVVTGAFDTDFDFEFITIPTSTISGYIAGTPYNGWVLRPTSTTVTATASIITREGAANDEPELEIDYACLPGYENDLAFGPGGCTGSRGSACSNNGQCASGVCSAGVCLADARVTCTANSQCINNRCVSGRCEGFNSRFTADKDTYVINLYPTANRGAGEELYAGRLTGEGTIVPRTILDFTPTIPEHAIIDSVQVRLTQVSAAGDANVTAHLRTIPGAWTEGTGSATSTSCGSGGATEQRANCINNTPWTLGSPVAASVTSITLDSNSGQKIWNLPVSEIAAMRSAGHNGYLLDIGSPAFGTLRTFTSAEGGAKWGNTLPTLSVNYRCAPGYTANGAACLGEPTAACTTDAECGGGNCDAGVCCMTSCADIECGNACGRPCNKPACPTGSVCGGGQCIDHCFDGVLSGNETGEDCGGRCARSCSTNCTCSEISECGNTDTCGGATCGSCGAGEICRVYELDYGRWGVCYDHCSDGLLNHGETQVDCGGGGCEPCAVGCSCVGRACGADDGCGNACNTGTCPTATEPASATLPLLQDDTARGAVQHSLGEVDTRWIGARGTTVGMLDDAPAVCGASDTGRDVYYHFRVCSPTNVRIYTTGAWTAHTLSLFPASRASFSTPVACSSVPRTIQTFLEPGDYYVLVKGTGSTTGTFNLYVRDDSNYQPTCGGSGVPGVCGSFDECADSLEEREPLERAQNHLGDDIVASGYTGTTESHEGKIPGLRMVNSTNSTLRSSLFFDGFEFGQRWTVQPGAAGTVTLQTGVSSPDTFTSRPSSRVARLAGNVWMSIRTPVVNVNDLQLRLRARTPGLATGENLYVQWSTDNALWTDLATYRGTTMTTVQANLTVDRRIDTIYLRLRTNAASTARYVDVDNVELRAQGTNASYADVEPRTPPVNNQVTWGLCDDEGIAQSGDDTTVLSPPAASDFCPAIAGPCRCAEDPASASAQDTCTTDVDCNADQRCSRLAGVYCTLVTGQSSCPTDAEGYLTTRYCTRPYPSCGNQPALGCFSGTIQLPTGDGSNTYSACANPAETPCKVVNDCPAGDFDGQVDEDDLPAAVVPVDAPGSVAGLMARETFDPLETSTAGICSMEMAADNSSFIRHTSSPACTSGEGRLGSAPVPTDIVKYSNCSNSVNPAPVRGMGDTKFDIDMAPNVYKVIMFRDLPLGEAQYMVDTGVSWEIAPIVWGNKFTLFGVDAGASLDRCEIGVRTDVTLLDQDIDVSELANSLTDSAAFPLTTPADAVTACKNILGLPKSVAEVREALAPNCVPSDLECIDTALRNSGQAIPGYFANQGSNGLIVLANKAKKALTDARHAINYWNALPDDRSMATVGGLCAYTKLYFAPGMHPAPGSYNPVEPTAECGVNIINAWINEYRMAMTRLGGLGPTTPSETSIDVGGQWDPNLQGGFTLVDEQVRYDVLAISFAFPVGPLSALLEVSAGGTYGIAGRIDYSTKPSGLVLAPNNDSSNEIARASATLTPGVSAVVTVFVGVGVGNQFIGAHIGVQGDLELVALSLPMEGVAELNRKRTVDAREIHEPWLNTQEGFDPYFSNAAPYFESQRYFSSYDANWYLNGYADIDLLNGSISLAARLRLLFYTLQFTKEIVDWTGIHKRITLVDLNGATGPEQPDPKTEVPADLGTFAATTPMPVLGNLVTDAHRNLTQETLAEQSSRLPLSSHLFGWNQQCILPLLTVD